MTDIASTKTIAWYDGQLIDRRRFSAHVLQTRESLQQFHHGDAEQIKLLNLCDDHYHFLVLFIASMLQGYITVMPSNRSEAELQRIRHSSATVVEMDDAKMRAICQRSASSSASDWLWSVDSILLTQIVAELYTSGSTGQPVANSKTWQQLLCGARQVLTRFNMNSSQTYMMVATVPPQHMFGFEMSVMLPLVGNVGIYHIHPFYPLDIQNALCMVSAPRILVTTPLHLKACTTLSSGWPETEFIITATAPLTTDIAEQIETLLNTEVREIYGSSETGAIATRRICATPYWHLLPEYQFVIEGDVVSLRMPSQMLPIRLPDQLLFETDGRFTLVGRNSDLIKIGGKRGSLADITLRLKKIPGVIDAVVFLPETDISSRVRLAALVIAPEISVEQLRQQLVQEIDPVFIPRPICRVTTLPYNNLGKLIRADLLNCLQQCEPEDELC